MDYIIRWCEQFVPPKVEQYDESDDIHNVVDHVLRRWRNAFTEVLPTRVVSIFCPKQNCIMVNLSHAGEVETHYFVSVTRTLHNLDMSQLFFGVAIYTVAKADGKINCVKSETFPYYG